MLKEEPDEALSHLTSAAAAAATATNCSSGSGVNIDVCVSASGGVVDALDDSSAPTLFGEIFDNYILSDSYGTLLPDEIGTNVQQQQQQQPLQQQQQQCSPASAGRHHHHAIVDPFMSYREESSCDTIGTPNQQLSPLGYPKVIGNRNHSIMIIHIICGVRSVVRCDALHNNEQNRDYFRLLITDLSVCARKSLSTACEC